MNHDDGVHYSRPFTPADQKIALNTLPDWATQLPITDLLVLLSELRVASAEERPQIMKYWQVTAEALADPDTREVLLHDHPTATLRQLRERAALSRVDVAQRMVIDEWRVTELELAPILTLHVTTLARYVEALGAGLRVIVTLDDTDYEL